MPKRHLVVLFFSIIASFACYQVASHNRLSNLLTHATDLMVNEGYYPVDEEQLLVSAMDGMLKNVDPFSEFQYGDRAIEREEFLKQSYAGLGIRIRREADSKLIRIVAPMYGSPAAEAGIQAGDLITNIDGQMVADLPSSDDIEKRIKGPEGTTVNLEILRTDQDGKEQTLELTVERRSIPTPSVVGDLPDKTGGWQFYLEDHPNIGYIRILQFGMLTAQEVRTALQAIDGKVDSLIIDLRGNPGGLLPAAVEISDQFLAEPGKTIVSIKDRNLVTEETFVSTAGKTLKNKIPVVVLINQNSASASEIVAACLQDHNLATVVGQKSYGKGTVQTQFALPRPNAKLTLTTASYWRPSGENIHHLRWRSDSATAPPDDLYESKWGVSPEEGFAVPLNERDSVILHYLYENRSQGIPDSEIDERTKRAIDRISQAASDNRESEPQQETTVADDSQAPEEDTESNSTDSNSIDSGAADSSDEANKNQLPDQIQWDDQRPLSERDPQLQKAIQFLTGQL